jgi:hypothetical protein
MRLRAWFPSRPTSIHNSILARRHPYLRGGNMHLLAQQRPRTQTDVPKLPRAWPGVMVQLPTPTACQPSVRLRAPSPAAGSAKSMRAGADALKPA